MNRRAFVCGLSAGIGTIAASACSNPAAKLPRYGAVPRFQLTDSHGRPFDGKVLDGKVWVADFVYTHCPGPCPRMTSQMHEILKKVRGEADVRLISFTVDPARDTPEVFNEFARRFGGPTDQWSFLTGPEATLHDLARNVFKVGDLVGVMDHSTRFMLVDKKRQIRGYYSTFGAEGLASLLVDLEALRSSRA